MQLLRLQKTKETNMAIKPKSQLEKRIDGIKSGGVGKDVGNASEIFNSYSGSSANSITDSSYAHAEGAENGISNSNYAHAEGDFNHISSSACSHAEGESSHIMNSKWAHAGGYGSYIMTNADCGFAHGYGARVTGGVAAAFGSQTLAAGRNQLVAGKGNIEDSEDKYALIIGNGTEDPRGQTSFKASNALTLDWEGNLWVSGDINFSGGVVTNYTAGRGIEINNGKIGINIASENVLGGVKAGDGVEIAADGTISVTGGAGGGSYTAGSGIEIAEDNTISVTPATETAIGGIILGEGLEYDAATGKTNTVPNIQQAVILQEKDAKYLLHEYTTIEYIAGNRIGYAGGQNQIIAQGYIIYKNGGTAPNGVKIASITSENLSELPDIPMYTDMSFSEPAEYISGLAYRITRSYVKFKVSTSTYDSYELTNVKTDGSEASIITLNNYNSFNYGVAFVWNTIHPPGYTTAGGVTYPYGSVVCTYAYKVKSSNTEYRFYVQGGNFFNIGFASEAEYNAAVGLTYEPQTLTQVNETVTEV